MFSEVYVSYNMVLGYSPVPNCRGIVSRGGGVGKKWVKWVKLGVLKGKDQPDAGQLLRSCLIFGQNLRLKAKQPSCL